MRKLFVLLALCLTCTGSLFAQQSLTGAWKSVSGDVTSVLLITPTWYTITNYKDKEFLGSFGGTYKANKGQDATIDIVYNTENSSQIGQSSTVAVSIQNGLLYTTSPGGSPQEWRQIDNSTGPLVGNWRISSREQNGKMNNMPLAARRTLKILTGTRFQWIAINIETGEFFGSGGGTYTFENGTYTEKIEFFSRDNSRVGAVLSFKGKVAGNDWDHSGLSSKGEPIHEIWSKTE
ncbi:membrane or secreted protein [Chitinophaga silvatica]|uniref:Membrane or secreted protein n=1 Tax=Chitinophaga silvatica TaxID=2282649 RepID=A0A3E1YEP3_9BACT|nr:membrane or secreted protein [Chitinophaga silvatica]RFS24981.1 membrane or secreted protein [Chitinophaga silvatica]